LIIIWIWYATIAVISFIGNAVLWLLRLPFETLAANIKHCIPGYHDFITHYYDFTSNINRTTTVFKAMGWWQRKALFWYAQIRWIVFIIVLAFWHEIACVGNKHKGVRRLVEDKPWRLDVVFIPRQESATTISTIDTHKDK
jgi:hypothetical protein|tara:strand:- start:17747 stop:18169 length:423 start_codon:yes stop_codon:yes gene_type:complete